MNHRKFCFNLVLFSLLSVLASRVTLAACSDGSDGNKAYIGMATLNEYYHNNQSGTPSSYFIESKLLTTSLNQSDYRDWSILICSTQAAGIYGPTKECVTGNQAIADDNTTYPDTVFHAGLKLSAASVSQNWMVLDETDGYPLPISTTMPRGWRCSFLMPMAEL